MATATTTTDQGPVAIDLIAAFEKVTGTTFTPPPNTVTDAQFEADDIRVQQHLSDLDDYDHIYAY